MFIAALFGLALSYEALWKTTGGQYNECTDVCFQTHMAGSASGAFEPLWYLTLFTVLGTFVGLSSLLVWSAVKSEKRRESRVRTDLVGGTEATERNGRGH
jgi:hypothetical protein